jgi:uncharacterized damage-inducible protein DinB
MTETLDPTETRRTLEATPTTLRQLLGHLPDDALAFHEAPGTWSAVEVLRHLADGEVHDWIPRARIILSDGDKRFTPFERERGLQVYRDWSGARMLNEFERLRGESLRAWTTLRLSEHDPSAQGIHPEFGPVTLGQLLTCWVTHDLAHVNQISRVLVRRSGRAIGPWTKYFSLLREH